MVGIIAPFPPIKGLRADAEVATGAPSIVAVGAIHWLCDLVWLFLISWVVFKSKRLWTPKVSRVVFGICAAVLAGFGVWFIYSGITLAVSA